MIGNDIVDLGLAEHQSNWKRKGWLQKIYTLQEQEYIAASKDPERMVWELWSRKEATYKAHQRSFAIAPKYNPIAFQCDAKCMVIIEGVKYYTQTATDSNYIHSIAQSWDSDQQYTNTHKIIIGDSATPLLLTQIAQQYNIAVATIRVAKDQYQIPRLYINNQISDLSFSLSHHGQYAAYVFVSAHSENSII